MKQQAPGVSEAVSFLAHATEAVDIVSETNIRVARVFVVSIATAAIVRTEPPRATTQNLCLSRRRASRIFLRRLFVIINFVEVVAPLPDVSGDVVKTPGIRFLLADRFGFSAGIFFRPGVLADLCGSRTPEIFRRGSGSTGILPFRFGRQT